MCNIKNVHIIVPISPQKSATSDFSANKMIFLFSESLTFNQLWRKCALGFFSSILVFGEMKATKAILQ